jgi:hypothetical protein
VQWWPSPFSQRMREMGTRPPNQVFAQILPGLKGQKDIFELSQMRGHQPGFAKL